MEFQPWPKIPRFSRDIVVTEKIDGTNAQITIVPIPAPSETLTVPPKDALGIFNGNVVFVGSRTRWIQPGKNTDNYGFAAWVQDNINELLKLGPGSHFGEWWGAGIQRRYGMNHKVFSLFNVSRWCQNAEGGVMDADGNKCLFAQVVPVLYRGPFDIEKIDEQILLLQGRGSLAAPGFMDPEGVVIYHTASKQLFKKTCKDDDKAKGQS